MDMTKLNGLMKQKKAMLKQKSKTLKPAPGTNRYVLLPGWRKGEEYVYFHEFGQHYIKNAAGEIQAVYPCMDATYGRPCPICDSVSKAIRMTSDEETVKLLEDAACGLKKQKYLLNVLALDSDEPAVPQILELGKQAYGQLVEMLEDADGGWPEALFDPATPAIFLVIRDGKGLNTKYTVQGTLKKHAMPAGALTKINNLDEYVIQESEENQRRAIGAINNVAGLLSAESSRDKPTPTVDPDDVDAALVAMEKASKVKPDIALDDELDSLLGELDGTATKAA